MPELQPPGVRPDISKLSPDVMKVYEEIGVMVNGRWKTDEELIEEWREIYPGWEPAAWPLGSTDITRMTGADYLSNPEVGGDPDAWPLGPPQVLTVGEILFDAIAVSADVKMGDPDDRWADYVGGAPANVAAALAKLGTPAAFVGSVGDDKEGGAILRALRDAQLPTKPVQVVQGGQTRRVYVTRDAAGDRSFAGFPEAPDAFADTKFDAAAFDGTLLYAADYLVTGTLGLATPETRSFLKQAREVADINLLVTLVDVNWRPMFWPGSPEAARKEILAYLEGACFVKMTDEEAAFLFGVDRAAPGDDGGAHHRGRQGLRLRLRGRLPAFDVPVVDTTGAGDAFTAGFVHKAIRMSGEFQDEMVDYGTGTDMPRGHLHTRERLREAFKDKTIAGECVLYASAVGAMTCMEEGAVAAQPPERLVNKFVQVYGDNIVITEEKRKTEVPKFKPLGWQFSR